MSDKEFPSCAYDVCAEFDCEETMALALIATRNELERTRKALEIAVDALNTIKGKHDPRCAVYHIDEKTAYDALTEITAIEQME